MSRRMGMLATVAIAATAAAPAHPGARVPRDAAEDAVAWAATPTRVGFAVAYRQEVSRYRVNAVSLRPGEVLTVAIAGGPSEARFEAWRGDEVLPPRGDRSWQWRAPDTPGLHRLRIRRVDTGDEMTLNVFVLVPASAMRRDRLNGYRIGRYPATPLRGSPLYRPPVGFVEVTPENEDTPLSPHFTLKQFLCKQVGGFPKYVVLNERLLLKLEYLLERLADLGLPVQTFEIMSGYRTPSYNQGLGNVLYSRHVWGAAVDVFVDQHPRDGRMDDLNGDGTVDRRDAAVLYDAIERITHDVEYPRFVGGLAKYPATGSHGPFVHIDLRDRRARW